MKSLNSFFAILFILLLPMLSYGQNCEVVVKLPTSNTGGNCGFTIKDSANNVILRENAIGGLFLNMPPNVGGIVHQGDVLSVNRGATRLLGAGYYLPENIYYVDIPAGIKFIVDFLAVNEIHGIEGDTVIITERTKIRDELIVNGYTRINNSGCYTGTWQQCSDLKLKKNVKRIANALSSVLKLRGVRYEWRKNEFPGYNLEDGTKIGFVAQDVEKVVPELVRTENDGMKSVNYSNMAALLVEAVKEQQKIIEQQQRTIENLENKLEHLESSVVEIQKTILERNKK
jgi:hypothetical protein